MNRESPARVSATSNNVFTAHFNCIEGRIARRTAYTGIEIITIPYILSFV